MGVHLSNTFGVRLGFLIGLAAIPLFITEVRRARPLVWLCGAALVALISAPLVADEALAANPSRSVDSWQAAGSVSTLVVFTLFACMFRWVILQLGLRTALCALGIGLAALAPLQASAWEANAWKYLLAWPVCIIVLAAVAKRGWVLQSLVICGLATLTVVFDTRNPLIALSLALAATVFGTRTALRPRTSGSAPTGRSAGILVLALAIVMLYLAFTPLAMSGLLGANLQQTTRDQVGQTGSLVTGARPEVYATYALAARQPWGYGPGAIAAADDVAAARQDLRDAGVALDPNHAYITDFMFGSATQLHSVAADLWLAFGLGGLAVSLIALVILARGASNAFIVEVAPYGPLVAFVAASAIWDLLFSPFASNWMTVAVGIAVCTTLPGRSHSHGRKGVGQRRRVSPSETGLGAT